MPLLHSPSSPRLWPALLLCAALLSGCALRSVPPIRYLPLIGKEKQISTTQVLARALQDRDLSVRAQAVRLLGILAQSQDEDVKKAAAQVLGMAAGDRDPGIRLQAIENLGTMEARYANKYLMAALRDPNPFVREKVLQMISQREGQQTPPPAAAQALAP